MIAGVETIPLRRIEDERGAVIPMLRQDAPYFEGFGEMYFSLINPGAVKAWKQHTRMTLNLAVPFGEVSFVLQDGRDDSATTGMTIVHRSDAMSPTLLIVPPGVWSGFTNTSASVSVVANCADILHDPTEAHVREPDDSPFPFDWNSLSSK